MSEPADYADLAPFPDGSRAAVSVLDSVRRTRDTWIYDTARGLQ